MRKNVPSRNDFGSRPKLLLYALAFSITLFSSLFVTAQSQLIKDVNTTENPLVLEYSELVTDGGTNVYFISRGKELWRINTTITPQTAVMLRSLRSISSLTIVGPNLFFVGEDGSGKELWKSNGTGASTRKVKEIRTGTSGSDPAHMIGINGILYFAADNGANGRELWKSDGTDAGTIMVKDLKPGNIGSYPSAMAGFQGLVYFSAHNGSAGYELWKTDGTSIGTQLVKDINAGSLSSSPTQLTVSNNKLFFVANTQTFGRELWMSDGTNSGTKLANDVKPGSEPSDITGLTDFNGHVYFSATDGTRGYELWKSNGATTFMITRYTDEEPLSHIRALQGRLYFTKFSNGYYIRHQSDGTEEGTIAIAYLDRNIDPRYTVLGDQIYYFSYFFDDEQYKPFYQLWRMPFDGSAAYPVRKFFFEEDWSEGMTPDYRPELVAANNQLYFYAILNDGEGYKMLRSRGTSSSTFVVKDTYIPTHSSDPEGFVTFKGITYFIAAGTQPYYATDVWRTDGTSEGTFLLHRFNYIPLIELSGNIIYFMGMNDNSAFELWKTDGSVNGTVMIKRFDENLYFQIGKLVDVYGTLYFADSEEGQLWKSNGTESSTILLKDFHRVKFIGKGGGRAIFSVMNADGADELWRSSGTPNSTAKLKSIKFTGGAVSNDTKRVTSNDLFYFFADDGRYGVEVWRSNGTTSGTIMIKDLRQNDGSENDFYALAAFRDSLYFAGKTNDNTYSLFKTNGTSAGTSKVTDLPFTNDLVPADNKLLIFTKGSEGSELWSTSGTAESTTYLMHLDSLQFRAVSHVRINGATYFSWAESKHLWRSDGSDCGTYTIETPPNPFPLGVNGDNILFGAKTVMFGKEPHRLSTLTLPASPCGDMMATSIENTLSEVKVIAYSPNPFIEKVTIRITPTEHTENVSVSVKSFSGQIMYTNENVSTHTDFVIGENWPKGLYVVNVSINGRSESFRLIKK